MSRYSLSTLTDATLLREVRTLVSQERSTTALLIAHLGEVDARRLYAEAGYPSMFAWCVEELHLSEESAYKRIRVARVSRQFPVIYDMLADGRLHLSAVVILASYLTPQNTGELLAVATHKSKAGIEQVLAERFPQPDLPTRVEAIPSPLLPAQLSPRTVKFGPTEQPSPEPCKKETPVTVGSKVAPLAPQRYAIQCTVDQRTYEKLKHAQALLGHAVPTGELAQVLERALDALIAQLERQKFAKTEHPRTCRVSENARHIPASVKHTVWERDGGRCTFVSESGHRCESRTRLEYDHVEPVATGGRPTVKGLRLRCRAHNQYEAERRFGRDFMRTKREASG